MASRWRTKAAALVLRSDAVRRTFTLYPDENNAFGALSWARKPIDNNKTAVMIARDLSKARKQGRAAWASH
jgi:hypothetical protein